VRRQQPHGARQPAVISNQRLFIAQNGPIYSSNVCVVTNATNAIVGIAYSRNVVVVTVIVSTLTRSLSFFNTTK
jgi:hypothetical protein